MGLMDFFFYFFFQIWDTLKGHLQTEFVDITASGESGLLSENKRGHLSLDYTCMKWVQLESKVLSLLISQINIILILCFLQISYFIKVVHLCPFFVLIFLM